MGAIQGPCFAIGAIHWPTQRKEAFIVKGGASFYGLGPNTVTFRTEAGALKRIAQLCERDAQGGADTKYYVQPCKRVGSHLLMR